MKRLLHWMMAALLLGSSAFASAADVLGAGDVVKISVYGNPDLAMETRVADNGEITVPLIGRVAVGGLSTGEAEKRIAARLESGGYLKKPQVSLVVTQVQSQAVSVLGHVNRPGRYPLEGGKRSLMDLLAQAGGIAQDGSDTVSLLRTRNGKTERQTIDVVNLVRNAELAQNHSLSAGDVIYVERAPRVYIYGEVQRPGPFRLERGMTVTQALAAGGGLTLRGTERGILIKRRDANGGLQTIKAKPDDVLQIDDVVYVKESWF